MGSRSGNSVMLASKENGFTVILIVFIFQVIVFFCIARCRVKIFDFQSHLEYYQKKRDKIWKRIEENDRILEERDEKINGLAPVYQSQKDIV